MQEGGRLPTLRSDRVRSIDVLYQAADVALYEAKRAGRDTWRWYGEVAVPPAAAAVPAADLTGP